jgi:hypothetical protein
MDTNDILNVGHKKAPDNAGAFDARNGIAFSALQFDPDMRVSNLKGRLTRLRPEHFAKYADALRKAGLPE